MSPEGWDESKTSFQIHVDPLQELRLEARKTAREMWVVYSELVRAGFSEDQSLALMLELGREE